MEDGVANGAKSLGKMQDAKLRATHTPPCQRQLIGKAHDES